MNKFIQIEQRALTLLDKRGIKGHVTADRFKDDFIAYLIKMDATEMGDANTTLSLLDNNSNLTDGSIFDYNFKKKLFDLISPALRADPIFRKLIPILLNVKGKGVGVGELFLPLIIAGYRFSNVSDGLLNGKKKEVKKKGASLKPLPGGTTEHKLVDKLNKKYFDGTVPGMREKAKFNKHLQSVKDPNVYRDYFKELYPNVDVSVLVEEVVKCYKDPVAFNTAVGKHVLKEYKKIDKWDSIIYIDDINMVLLNICDVNNIDDLGLIFIPKLSRKRDVQAISDGYVNVTFK